jgi:hypothetical protein
MIGAVLEGFLPPREVLFGGSGVPSNLLYLFIISGLARGVVAALLARRVRELRKPRKALSAPALVLRVTGVNAMMGLVYDFIGRPQADADDAVAEKQKRASTAENGDNSAPTSTTPRSANE